MKKKILLAFTAAAVSLSPITAFASTESKAENCYTDSFDSFARNYLISSGLISEDCIYCDSYIFELLQNLKGDDCREILFDYIMNNCGIHGPSQRPDEPDEPGDTENPDEPGEPENPGDTESPDEPGEPENPGDTDIPVIPDMPHEPDDGTHHNDGADQEAEFAAEVVRLVNIERAKAGLSALETDYIVQEAAQVRAREIELSFSHTRPDGRSCFTALDEVGAVYSGAGENIAYGQHDPEEVMEAWMNSTGHRENILNESYTHIGVGCYESGGTYYWSQFFTH